MTHDEQDAVVYVLSGLAFGLIILGAFFEAWREKRFQRVECTECGRVLNAGHGPVIYDLCSQCEQSMGAKS